MYNQDYYTYTMQKSGKVHLSTDGPGMKSINYKPTSDTTLLFKSFHVLYA